MYDTSYYRITAGFWKPVPFLASAYYTEEIRLLSTAQVRFESENFPQASAIIIPYVVGPQRLLRCGYRQAHMFELTAYFKNIGAPSKYLWDSKPFNETFFTPYFTEAFTRIIAQPLKEASIDFCPLKPSAFWSSRSYSNQPIPAFAEWEELRAA